MEERAVPTAATQNDHKRRPIWLLLAGCGKDAAPGTTGATGEDGLPKPDTVSGSVTGMPNPGESTPNPGQPVDMPPVDELDVPADIVPVDGEAPADVDGMPQTATGRIGERR